VVQQFLEILDVKIAVRTADDLADEKSWCHASEVGRRFDRCPIDLPWDENSSLERNITRLTHAFFDFFIHRTPTTLGSASYIEGYGYERIVRTFLKVPERLLALVFVQRLEREGHHFGSGLSSRQFAIVVAHDRAG
jgi:hypothetical protein